MANQPITSATDSAMTARTSAMSRGCRTRPSSSATSVRYGWGLPVRWRVGPATEMGAVEGTAAITGLRDAGRITAALAEEYLEELR